MDCEKEYANFKSGKQNSNSMVDSILKSIMEAEVCLEDRRNKRF